MGILLHIKAKNCHLHILAVISSYCWYYQVIVTGVYALVITVVLSFHKNKLLLLIASIEIII
jgi:hypothetical protein